jgi:5-methylcytosine-specific restriction endonuclease McrA
MPPQSTPVQLPLQIQQKRCRRCGVEQSFAAFAKDAQQRDGLRSYCKACQRIQNARRYPNAVRRVVRAGFKWCNRCQTEQPVASFHRDRSNRDGLFSACHSCAREYRAAYYRQNRERELARMRVWQKAHPERVRANNRASHVRCFAARAAAKRRWRERNRERRRRTDAQWRERNRAALREATRRRFRDDPPAHYRRLARYYATHPEKRSQLSRQASARRRARIVAATVGRVDYAAIWERDAGCCQICHTPVAAREVHFDHRIPLSKGGAHTMANVRVTHARCNLRKGARL